MTSDSQAKEKQRRFSYLQFKLKVIETLKYFKLIFTIIKPYCFLVFLNYTVNLLQTCMSWYAPVYTGNIIDIATRSKDVDQLWTLLRDMFIFNIVFDQVNNFCSRIKNKASEALKRDMKCEMYKGMLNWDIEFFDQVSTSEVTKSLDEGSGNLTNFCIHHLTDALQAVFKIFGSLYRMYLISPELSNVILFTLPFRFGLAIFYCRQYPEWTDEVRALYDKAWTLPVQAIENILLVKCFSSEKKEHKDYSEAMKKLSEHEMKCNVMPWHVSLITESITQGINVYQIYRGGQMVFNGAITAGDLSMLNAYATTLTDTISNIQWQFKSLYRAYMDSLNILRLIEESSKIRNKRESQGFTKEKLTGAISINNVSFSYPAKAEVEVLSDINLKINAGEAVAFVGASGSGKTTLSYLLQNLYIPTQGKIFIDGEDIRDYKNEWLHHEMSYVPQEPFLFDRTVEENIVYGIEDDYTPEHIEKALLLSNSKFILNKERFPDGLKTKLGSGSTQLSGGQKQRIAIARAFIKDPKVLILDEPTSALDGESESKVQKAIDDLVALGDRTVIVIAHRLSTIINCHKIVVFDDGKIVEQGTHKELMGKDGAYKKLFEFQINNMKNL